jgi:hypothetical protein
MTYGRIHIEKINDPILFEHGGKPAEYSAGLKLAIERGLLWMHESGTYVKFTQARRRDVRMTKCTLAAAVTALLILGSAADAESDTAVLSMCQSLFKAYKSRASPCRLRTLRDGVCREFPEIVDQLNKLMISRDSLLMAWQDCPGGLAGAERERARRNDHP